MDQLVETVKNMNDEKKKRTADYLAGMADNSGPDLQLYTLKQIADRLGCTTRTLCNHVRAGRLRARRIGRRYLVTRESLLDFLNVVDE